MPFKLLIRFNESSLERVAWALLDESGKLLESQNDQLLSTIEHPNLDYELIAIVPGNLITQTKAQLPHASRLRLLQAVPYALENQIADNIEQLHFAIGDRNSEGQLSISYLEESQLLAWLHALEEADFKAGKMVPDNLLLPLAENSWSAYVENSNALVRTEPQIGFVCDQENLAIMLKSLMDSEPEKQPQHITLANHPEIKELALDTTSITNDNYFAYIAEELQKPLAINLLQGKYKTESKFDKLNYYWRLSIKLAIAWIALLIIGHIVEFGYYHFQRYRLSKKVIALYQQVFPAATDISDPRSSLQAKLNKYQGPGGVNSLLVLLGKAGGVLHQMPQAKLQGIKFQQNSLQLSIVIDSFAALDKFMQQLTSQGLTASRENATSKNQTVVATIKIGMRA